MKSARLNLPDFVKFAGFHEIRNKRPIARNGKAYVFQGFPEGKLSICLLPISANVLANVQFYLNLI